MQTNQEVARTHTQKPLALLPLEVVLTRTGLSESTIRKGIVQGWFPAGRKIGPRCVRWLESDLEQWAQTLPVAELQAA